MGGLSTRVELWTAPRKPSMDPRQVCPNMGEGLAIIPTCACWQQVSSQEVGLLLTQKRGAFSQLWTVAAEMLSLGGTRVTWEKRAVPAYDRQPPLPVLSLPSISDAWLETAFLTGTRQKLLCSTWSQGSSPYTANARPASRWPELRSSPHQTGVQGRGPSAPSWH